GEGSSIIQERSHAFAMKSQMWLVDPRPSLPKMVEMVEKAFQLSEASSTPVLLELRIRACHVHGSFRASMNLASGFSRKNPIEAPDFDFGRICLPPATYVQEKHKVDVRWPAAVAFIKDHALNEFFDGERKELGILCQGGMYNAVIRALQLLGFADAFGASKIPIYCLNVAYPLIPEEISAFAKGKSRILIVEEGQPAYIEDAVLAALRRAGENAVEVHGKDVLPLAGEYTGEVVLKGVSAFLGMEKAFHPIEALKKQASELLGPGLPIRPPGFCVGCPERPVFAAMKVVERQSGKFHVSADIGCHTFATLPPFNVGHTVLGYGLGLASNSAVDPLFARRTLTIMGDGGFWHNGLTSGIANAVFNKDDGIVVIMKNGYTSATGTQELLSSPRKEPLAIERALQGMGVEWVRTVDNYRVGAVAETLKDAMNEDYKGLKVIVAEGECQLERQRRLRPEVARKLSNAERHVRVKYGVDEDTCTGDHSCIRLSGCPTLTVKDNPDPLRRDPVATVIEGCVGCGLCGENAHAAVLCPSFYRAEVVQNPRFFDKLLSKVRDFFHGSPVH
ncbi:MAG: indolepyruvate ferredoxin oxidoreductase subunit alpha, partial [Betaproteobacteria bacterium]|nr:indolepyruvate ferredoxin oxidoreductase subunit alpha [Betaproteobacteria bacterium]